MKRRLPAAVLVMTLLASGPAAAGEDAGRSRGFGGRLFWGALTMVNGVILASSVNDMRLYQDRAREAEAAGGDADEYWNASSREKLVVGLSAASLLVSLAGLRSAFTGNGEAALPPLSPVDPPSARPAADERGSFEILAFEQQVRYDTLLGVSGAAPPLDSAAGWGTGEPPEEDPLDLAFRRAIRGEDPAPVSGAAPPALPEEEEELPSGEPASGEPSSGEEEWTVESGSEWEAVLAARREAGMIPAPPAATPQARPEEVRDGSNSPAADPVALLLRDLRPETPAPVPPEEPAPAPVDPPAEEEGPADFALLPWAVHVSSFRTFTKAEEDEAVWTGRGENVLIEEAKIPEKGTWFRVLVGNFADRAAAEAHAAKVKERFGLDYVQVRRHPGF